MLGSLRSNDSESGFASTRQKHLFLEDQSGVISLLLAVAILPILTLLLSIGLEVGTAFYDRGVEQKTLDNAAMYAAQQLPFLQNADLAAKTIMAAQSATVKKYGLESLAVSVTSDSVQLVLTMPMHFPMAENFNIPNNLSYHIRSLARVQPRDVAIYFDSSRYLTPDLNTASSPNPIFWGLPSTSGGNDWVVFKDTTLLFDSPDWRAATFFMNFPSPTALDPGNDNYPQRVANVRTQQCFNPAYSALKEASIRLYYSLSLFNLNSVGVFSGPSAIGDTFTIRNVRKGGFPSSLEGEAVIENIANSTSQLRDEHCLAAAEIAQAELDVWRSITSQDNQENQFPPAKTAHAFPSFSSDVNSDILNNNYMPPFQLFVDHNNGNFIPGNEKYLSVREAVWARRASVNRVLDTRTAIDTVGDALNNAPLRINERGALYKNVSRTGYIILGHMPRVKESGVWYKLEDDADKAMVRQKIRDSLDNVNSDAISSNRSIFIYILLVRNEQMYPDCGQLCTSYINDHKFLFDRIENWNANWSNLKVSLVRVPDSGSLVTELAGFLPTSEQAVFLGQ